MPGSMVNLFLEILVILISFFAKPPVYVYPTRFYAKVLSGDLLNSVFRGILILSFD